MGFDGAAPLPPGHERAQLVVDLSQYLALWEQLLARPGMPDPSIVAGLLTRGIEMQTRARTVGFGGVAHHLGQCNRFLDPRVPLDLAGLRAALKDLSELAWQAKQELAPAERMLVDQNMHRSARPDEAARGAGWGSSPPVGPVGGGSSPANAIAPPPMITVFPNQRHGSAPAAPPFVNADVPPAVTPPPPIAYASRSAPAPMQSAAPIQPVAPIQPAAVPVAAHPAARPVHASGPARAPIPAATPLGSDQPPASQPAPKLAVRPRAVRSG